MRKIRKISITILYLLAFLLPQESYATIIDDPDFSEAPYITSLDIDELEIGRHHFYFQIGHYNTGTPIAVPIMVIKGAHSGKKLMLTAGTHGDELNGIRVIHGLFDRLDPESIAGAIIAVPGLNQPGLKANTRYFMSSAGGGGMQDLNRLFPGKAIDGGAASAYVHSLWQSILRDNADLAIDLHTQTQGTAYPLFVFADFRNSKVRDIAFQLGPDIIKNDVGETGTLETTYMRAGIPAVTFEIGKAKIFQPELISRAIDGLLAAMKGEGILLKAHKALKNPPEPIIGRDHVNIHAKTGGSVVIHVALKQAVTKGDHIATQYDAFGQVLHEYYAPHSGHVLAIATDPLREPGALLVRILY